MTEDLGNKLDNNTKEMGVFDGYVWMSTDKQFIKDLPPLLIMAFESLDLEDSQIFETFTDDGQKAWVLVIQGRSKYFISRVKLFIRGVYMGTMINKWKGQRLHDEGRSN